jgi:hypothetical protein
MSLTYIAKMQRGFLSETEAYLAYTLEEYGEPSNMIHEGSLEDLARELINPSSIGLIEDGFQMLSFRGPLDVLNYDSKNSSEYETFRIKDLNWFEKIAFRWVLKRELTSNRVKDLYVNVLGTPEEEGV